MRNQNIVQTGNKTHHEEQGGQHGEGEIIVAFGSQAISPVDDEGVAIITPEDKPE